MFVYWSFVLIPALLALTESLRRKPGRQSALLIMLFDALFLVMGLRETGGDYSTYLTLYEILDGRDIATSLGTVEPLYGFLNWLSAELGLGLYGVNSACALVFLYCLYRAAGKERLPLFLTALAIPYFVIVVGMGYTRQGAAAALILLGLVQLREKRGLRACVSIVTAAGFHYSAFAALAIPLFVVTRQQSTVMWVLSRATLVLILAASSQTFLSDKMDAYSTNYIESDHYKSSGAFLRSLVSAAAGAVFFLYRRDFRRLYDDYDIWRIFAVLALLSPPLSFVASTPVDRVGIYLLPFQFITFSRFPIVFRGGRLAKVMKLTILLAYLLYFFVWLHFGAHSSQLWVPYRWIFS